MSDIIDRLRAPMYMATMDGNRLVMEPESTQATMDEAAGLIASLRTALAAEREQCAKVAEEISPLTAGKVIAAAIRARGQK